MNRSDGLPGWVVPTWFAVSDVSCLALRGVVEDRARMECAGMVAALGWVRGAIALAPVTGRDETPVTCELAQAEAWAAAEACPRLGCPHLPEAYEQLRVCYREPVNTDDGYTLGVCGTLRWLTGRAEQPPLPVPVRTDTGALASAEDVFRWLLAERSGPVSEPIRARYRRQAREVVAISAHLAALAADTAVRIHS